MRPRIRLLGRPEVEFGRQKVLLPAERRALLLAVLALQRAPVQRDWLAGLFWPDRDNATARRNLRKLAFDAQEFDWAAGVESGRSTLAWPVETDVEAFDRAAAAGNHEELLRLYRGPLLEGLDDPHSSAFAELLQHERSRRADRWHSAALTRLGQLVDRPEAVLELTATMLAADPLDEDAVAARMQAQQTLRRSADATRTFRAFKETLAATLGIEPSARLRDLGRSIEPGSVAAGVQPPSTAALPSFIGRTAELKEVRALLARPECRVLTITGVGGSGKSWLARAAVRAMQAEGAEAHWIGLEDLERVAQVAPRIAEVVGVELDGRRDPVSNLLAHLRRRVALLVLDNSEHLEGLGPLVERIVAECPAVKLLNTSRTRLGTGGEWLLPLEGLALPDADEDDVEVLRAFDSIRLFEARALAGAPGFSLREQAADVRRLVELVGGLPLALELAAAWTRLLPVRDILAEIARSTELLEGHEPARERSMRASFEHSWNLLAPAERSTLAALAIFQGTFSRSAAAVVAQARLPLLAALVDKSMLRAHGDGNFSLHFLIRQFAADRSEEADALRRRHAEYFADRLAHLAAGGSQKEATRVLRLELADCGAAWRHALASSNTNAVLKMVGPLWDFFDREGRWDEAAAMLEAALSAFDEQLPAQRAAVAVVARTMTTLLIRRGRYEAAETLARHALKLARLVGDRATIRGSLHAIGGCRAQLGDPVHARPYFEDCLRRARADGAIADIASYGNGLATLEKQHGNYERAVQLYEESLALKRKLGEMRGVAVALHNLGNLYRGRDQLVPARRYLEEALQVCEDHGLQSVRSSCLANLGMTLLQQGDLARAEPYYLRALTEVRSSGERLTEVFVLLGLTRIATLGADRTRARKTLSEALSLSRENAAVPLQLECIVAYAEMLAKEGEAVRAAALCRFAHDHAALNAQDRAVAERLERSFGLDDSGRAQAGAQAARMDLDAVTAEIRRELEVRTSPRPETVAGTAG